MYSLGIQLAAFLQTMMGKVKERSVLALRNEDAMATLEIVLLIAILVALALMFKDTIVGFVEGVLDSISSQSGVFDPASIAP